MVTARCPGPLSTAFAEDTALARLAELPDLTELVRSESKPLTGIDMTESLQVVKVLQGQAQVTLALSPSLSFPYSFAQEC